MAQERVVRREEHVETAETKEQTTVAPQQEVVRETRTTETKQVTPDDSVTNVNVNSDPASGNVNINTPDGTQVNINS